MVLKRFTAFTLALLMLLILLPQATADGAHTHKWTEVGRTNPTCTQAGQVTYSCSCGQRKTEKLAALGHNYTKKTYTAYADCTHYGMFYWTCARCGAKSPTGNDRPLGHDWDEGAVTKAPTSSEDGVRTYTCRRDPSHTRTEAIPALGKAGSAALALDGEQDGGSVTLSVTNTGANDISGVTLVLSLTDGKTAGFGTWVISPEGWELLPKGKTLTAKLDLPELPEISDGEGLRAYLYGEAAYRASGTPDGAETAVYSDVWTAYIYPWAVSPATFGGEGLTIEETVTNAPKDALGRFAPDETIVYAVTVTNDTAFDLTDISLYQQLEPAENGPWESIAFLAAGETTELKYSYTLTKEECEYPHLYNRATAKWKDPQTQLNQIACSDTVYTELYVPDDSEPDVSIKLELINSAKDPDGRFAPGEQMVFGVTVTNNSPDDIKGAGLYSFVSPNAASFWRPFDIGAGKTEYLELEYAQTLSEWGYTNGFADHMFNLVWMKWTDKSSEDVRKTDSNLVYVKLIPLECVTLDMEVVNAPKDPKGRFAPGEEIVFGITLTATSYSPLNDVRLDVTLEPAENGPWAAIDLVEVGKSAYLEYKYVPSEEECESGQLVNQAAVVWQSEDYMLPAFGMASAELYVPHEPTPDDHCARLVETGPDGSPALVTVCCTGHRRLLGRTAAAKGANELKQAESGWLKEIDSLYSLMAEKADTETAGLLLAERDAWLTRHETLAKVLPSVYGDPETCARALLYDAMLRCTGLCCGIYGESGELPEDLASAIPVIGREDGIIFDTASNRFTLTSQPELR
ncbi:MAG: hypothetical protein IKX84_03285 [Clostridia bacterium]|nr:hypothetical protein [Clostridia bacterium]